MILDLPRSHSEAILGAMAAVALEHGAGSVTEQDRMTISAAARIVFGRKPGGTDPEPRDPAALAAAVTGEDEARQAVRMLAVMSMVDGELDPGKVELVRAYARELGVEEPYLDILHEAIGGEIDQAKACIIRKNASSFPHLDTEGIEADAVAPFLPYRDAPDPDLEGRYAGLSQLPENTFGRAFHDHFKRNGFAFPGNPAGLAEGFTTPHDSSHVLSGYSTSQQGELCVSTFIGAMHPDHPMAAEVLPVLFSWHLGIRLNEIAGASTGAFEPRKFWTAWDRGAAMNTDLVGPDWDFWAATEVDLEELRRRYGLPPADPALLA